MLGKIKYNKILLRTPFLEFSQMAGFEMYENEDVPAGSIVTGIGLIHG
jgi:3-methylcrotonyl-CoA carboxylase beta subunit